MLNALQINQKNYSLSTFLSSNRQNSLDSGKVLAASVSEYCSSALPADAYKIVITTVYLANVFGGRIEYELIKSSHRVDYSVHIR